MKQSEIVQSFVEDGWKIVSDGPSGVQLEGPKKMRGLDKACLVFGAVTLVFYGVGLFFIAIALLDYALLTKPETKFIPR